MKGNPSRPSTLEPALAAGSAGAAGAAVLRAGRGGHAADDCQPAALCSGASACIPADQGGLAAETGVIRIVSPM